MSALSIQPTYPIFTDIDGQPLDDGYIFIGVANLQPIGNPINVYWDAALTQPAAQPIRTVSGYPSNAGTPARLYVNSDYSIQVQNKNGTLVYSAPAATERYSDVVVSSVNAADVVYDPPFTNAVPTNAEEQFSQTVSVFNFMTSAEIADVQAGTALVDVTTPIQNAVDFAVSSGKGIVFPVGAYLITAPITINETSGVQLKAEKYRGVTIKKVGNAVDSHYGVDALLIIKNTSPGYGYSHHIDGLSFDAQTSSNAYCIYAPRISQCVFENGLITGALIGVYSFDAWLCSLRNMNISCGNPFTPTVIPAGSIGILMDRGTSLFLQNVWCRVCETGYKFTTSMAYSSMNSCACDGFSGVAYDFTGSSFAINGGGAEATVGTSAIVYKLSNSRVTLNGAASFGLGPSIYFDLFLSEMSINNSSFGASTNVGAGTTFRSRGGSILTWHGRVFPTNTATVFFVDATSQLAVYTAAAGFRYFRDDGVGNILEAKIPDNNGNVKPTGHIVLPYNKQYYVTNLAGTEQIVLSKNIVDNGIDLRNVNTSPVYLLSNSVRQVQVDTLKFSPVTDNVLSLGAAAIRWTEVYAVAPAINTSDAREKQQVRELSTAERAAALRCKSLLRAFKWNHAVEQKGDAARIHFGVMAQDVKAAFEAEGLDAHQYGLFCYDEWEARDEVRDEDGSIIMEAAPAGNRYGVRYEELLAFIIGAM
jgi:hypothetical protein